ncbi:hypothetical protein [Streptomyces lincolnensis]
MSRGVSTALWWHPVHTHDVAHIWLRETATRAARKLLDRETQTPA